ncbi:MAG: hypothetical protein ACTTJH_07555 [Bacteroidales bacterium]
MKKFCIITMIVLATLVANAQNWGVGVKSGVWDYGFNIKKYEGINSMEGVFDFHQSGFRATGLYEWNQEIKSSLHLYYGLGASIGMWEDGHNEADFGLGINATVGIEWHFPDDIPLSLALDWTPGFELIPASGFYGRGFAISIKYVW